MFETDSNAIEEAKALYYRMESEKAIAEKLYSLAFDDYIKTIKNKVYYYQIEIIHDYLKTKRKARLIGILEFAFGKKSEIKIDAQPIDTYGFESYAYGIRFKYKDKHYELYIPDVAKITKENISSLHEGKAALYYEEAKGVWSIVDSSYDIKSFNGKI